MALERRNSNGCVYNDYPSFCEWSQKMADLLDTEDPLDRVDICRLCQDQDTLKTLSYLAKQLKNR